MHVPLLGRVRCSVASAEYLQLFNTIQMYFGHDSSGSRMIKDCFTIYLAGPSCCVLGSTSLLPHMHSAAVRQDIEVARAARTVFHPVLAVVQTGTLADASVYNMQVYLCIDVSIYLSMYLSIYLHICKYL